MAVVFACHKRRSNDRPGHTLIRAAYLVAWAVGWVPRRPDTPIRIADDLTHTDFASTLALDKHAVTTTLQSSLL